MHSMHGENMLSALHQPPRGFPRYRSDRVDSSYEKEISLRLNKLYLHSQRTYRSRSLRVERYPRCTRCMRKSMSALHHTPRRIPRYHRDYLDSSFEKETSLRVDKLFLQSPSILRCRPQVIQGTNLVSPWWKLFMKYCCCRRAVSKLELEEEPCVS